MQHVAERVLGDLGLSQHHALMVAHKDREHAHVHVMVNRVPPDTGAAWERWQDRPKIERALREVERTLGLRQVAGRLHEVSEPTALERPGVNSEGRREIARTADLEFVEHVRSLLPELGTASPYRRKWRSERSHHPLKAVAVAGGWTDLDTMLKCYDQPDDAELLAVTSEPRKRREVSPCLWPLSEASSTTKPRN